MTDLLESLVGERAPALVVAARSEVNRESPLVAGSNSIALFHNLVYLKIMDGWQNCGTFV